MKFKNFLLVISFKQYVYINIGKSIHEWLMDTFQMGQNVTLLKHYEVPPLFSPVLMQNWNPLVLIMYAVHAFVTSYCWKGRCELMITKAIPNKSKVNHIKQNV